MESTSGLQLFRDKDYENEAVGRESIVQQQLKSARFRCKRFPQHEL